MRSCEKDGRGLSLLWNDFGSIMDEQMAETVTEGKTCDGRIN